MLHRKAAGGFLRRRLGCRRLQADRSLLAKLALAMFVRLSGNIKSRQHPPALIKIKHVPWRIDSNLGERLRSVGMT
jgi:hypothetical protein